MSRDAALNRWGPDDGTCPECGVECADNRYKNNRRCKECVKAAAKARRDALDPEERREAQRRNTRNFRMRRYGIDHDDYERAVEEQNGICPICDHDDQPLVVDHDHDTGEVRGFICRTCNSGLGLLRDDPEVLRRASEYLTGAKVAAPSH